MTIVLLHSEVLCKRCGNKKSKQKWDRTMSEDRLSDAEVLHCAESVEEGDLQSRHA